jgi:predicted Zn-dependent protease
MVFGPDPREGFFASDGKAGGTFYHPELRFRIDFPSGWTTSNQKTAVGATSPNEDARLVLELAGGVSSPSAAADRFFAQQGIRAGQTWRRDIHGLPAAAYTFDATTQQGELSGLVAWVDYGGKIYQILGFTPANRFRTYSDVFATAIGSFQRETSQRVLAVEPRRLKIQELSQPRPFSEVVRQFPSTVSTETIALINHLEGNATLPAGTDFKRVVGGPTQ